MQGTPVRFGAVTALVRCSVTGDGRQGVAASLARKKKARRGKRVAKGDEEALRKTFEAAQGKFKTRR